jgi:hypothetical protein
MKGRGAERTGRRAKYDCQGGTDGCGVSRCLGASDAGRAIGLIGWTLDVFLSLISATCSED